MHASCSYALLQHASILYIAPMHVCFASEAYCMRPSLALMDQAAVDGLGSHDSLTDGEETVATHSPGYRLCNASDDAVLFTVIAVIIRRVRPPHHISQRCMPKDAPPSEGGGAPNMVLRGSHDHLSPSLRRTRLVSLRPLGSDPWLSGSFRKLRP